MDSKVKKTLVSPIKKLSSCVTGLKEEGMWAGHRAKRRTGGVRSPPSWREHTTEPPVIHSYEWKLKEALKAQKNAERSAMRNHFRQKYQLSKSSKDTTHVSWVGGNVALPRELANMIHPETLAKDDGYTMLNAFQGLSFSMGTLRGTQSKSPSAASANGNLCKVM
ncbi:hypothetical protein DPEC_G00142880 [Dallia pectoralis]|uniref:Uncharacterized protein n=1 Tax=Dallia pectoralis TaxID=75939 RepID=A0ACC2GN20_DALPE|nr:hypothetical protein DPEC_G00142880 [Dallia pectoralis]